MILYFDGMLQSLQRPADRPPGLFPVHTSHAPPCLPSWPTRPPVMDGELCREVQKASTTCLSPSPPSSTTVPLPPLITSFTSPRRTPTRTHTSSASSLICIAQTRGQGAGEGRRGLGELGQEVREEDSVGAGGAGRKRVILCITQGPREPRECIHEPRECIFNNQFVSVRDSVRENGETRMSTGIWLTYQQLRVHGRRGSRSTAPSRCGYSMKTIDS